MDFDGGAAKRRRLRDGDGGAFATTARERCGSPCAAPALDAEPSDALLHALWPPVLGGTECITKHMALLDGYRLGGRELGVGGAVYQVLAPGAGGGPLRLQEQDAPPVATAVAGPVLQRDAISGQLRPLYSIQLATRQGAPVAAGQLDASGRMHGSWTAFSTLSRAPMALTYHSGLLHGRQQLALDGQPAALPLTPALPDEDVELVRSLLCTRNLRLSGAWEQGHPVHVITTAPSAKPIVGRADQVLLYYTKGARFARGAEELDAGELGSAPSALAGVGFWSPVSQRRILLGVTLSRAVADADVQASVALHPNPAACFLGLHLSGERCGAGLLPLQLRLRGGVLEGGKASAAGGEGGLRVTWHRPLSLLECARGLLDGSIGHDWHVAAVHLQAPTVLLATGVQYDAQVLDLAAGTSSWLLKERLVATAPLVSAAGALSLGTVTTVTPAGQLDLQAPTGALLELRSPLWGGVKATWGAGGALTVRREALAVTVVAGAEHLRVDAQQRRAWLVGAEGQEVQLELASLGALRAVLRCTAAAAAAMLPHLLCCADADAAAFAAEGVLLTPRGQPTWAGAVGWRQDMGDPVLEPLGDGALPVYLPLGPRRTRQGGCRLKRAADVSALAALGPRFAAHLASTAPDVDLRWVKARAELTELNHMAQVPRLVYEEELMACLADAAQEVAVRPEELAGIEGLEDILTGDDLRCTGTLWVLSDVVPPKPTAEWLGSHCKWATAASVLAVWRDSSVPMVWPLGCVRVTVVS